MNVPLSMKLQFYLSRHSDRSCLTTEPFVTVVHLRRNAPLGTLLWVFSRTGISHQIRAVVVRPRPRLATVNCCSRSIIHKCGWCSTVHVECSKKVLSSSGTFSSHLADLNPNRVVSRPPAAPLAGPLHQPCSAFAGRFA